MISSGVILSRSALVSAAAQAVGPGSAEPANTTAPATAFRTARRAFNASSCSWIRFDRRPSATGAVPTRAARGAREIGRAGVAVVPQRGLPRDVAVDDVVAQPVAVALGRWSVAPSARSAQAYR